MLDSSSAVPNTCPRCGREHQCTYSYIIDGTESEFYCEHCDLPLTVPPLTEERVREIVRKELDAWVERMNWSPCSVGAAPLVG